MFCSHYTLISAFSDVPLKLSAFNCQLSTVRLCCWDLFWSTLQAEQLSSHGSNMTSVNVYRSVFTTFIFMCELSSCDKPQKLWLKCETLLYSVMWWTETQWLEIWSPAKQEFWSGSLCVWVLSGSERRNSLLVSDQKSLNTHIIWSHSWLVLLLSVQDEVWSRLLWT